MKIAIVHDQLSEFGGAERVLVSLKKIFPQADIYTSAYDKERLGVHANLILTEAVRTSWFGKIPIINKLYSPLRFLTPLIWESFDFSKYDLVISSSGSWMSKGVITKKPTIHVCYLHHPPRYLYGYETAVEWQKYWPIKIYGNIINHFLRLWDFKSSQRPDYFIANSEETRRRIQKFYRRDATVIYPPVNIPKTSVIASYDERIETKQSQRDRHVPLSGTRDDNDYYLTVSRLARAKHVDVLIKASNKMKFNLKIVGIGRDEKYLKSIAGPTVEFLGNVSDEKIKNLYLNAKAFLFASRDEEFGIAPVEAMGYGLPVIAFNSGGLPEFVKNNINGFLFNQLNENSLIERVNELADLSEEKYLEMKKNARLTAENFSEEKFKKEILSFVNSKL